MVAPPSHICAASPQDTCPVLTLDFILVGTAGWAGNMGGQTPASNSELFLSEASTWPLKTWTSTEKPASLA